MGTVDIFKYNRKMRPEFLRCFRAGVVPGTGTLLDHRHIKNTATWGREIFAALLAYYDSDGISSANASRGYQDNESNKYVNRPCCMRISQASPAKYFTYWLSDDDTFLGRYCPSSGGDIYFVCEFPDDTSGGGHPAGSPVMTIDTIQLRGAYIHESRQTTFYTYPAAGFALDFARHLCQIANIYFYDVSTGNMELLGFQTDFILRSDRHNIKVLVGGPPAAAEALVCLELSLQSDLTLTDSGGQIFAEADISSTPIVKTASDFVTIVWKIEMHPIT